MPTRCGIVSTSSPSVTTSPTFPRKSSGFAPTTPRRRRSRRAARRGCASCCRSRACAATSRSCCARTAAPWSRTTRRRPSGRCLFARLCRDGARACATHDAAAPPPRFFSATKRSASTRAGAGAHTLGRGRGGGDAHRRELPERPSRRQRGAKVRRLVQRRAEARSLHVVQVCSV